MTTKDCFRVRSGDTLRGTTIVPGDKSLSHRAVMFGALADGVTHVRGWLPAGDTEASLGAIRALGINIERHDPHTLTIHGGKLQKSEASLDLVNAGTGIRLLAGIMVGQPFESVLDGSEQLRRRPMNRIIQPLRLMGANIDSLNGYAPLKISPAKLHGINYTLPIASAQVKSAILLAALFADSETIVSQPGPARDHTERMLAAMGADLTVDGLMVSLKPGAALKPMDFIVPADISSAAFPLVAALIVPNSEITLTNINLNPTRTGILDVLREMGGDITVTETGLEAGEPVGTIRARYSQLKGIKVGGEVVVRMIDEFPIFTVAALFAEGETVVREAGELRVKETDRIAVMVSELAKLGAQINETPDGFTLKGAQSLAGAVVDGHDDHRIAMSLVVAGLAAEGETIVLDARCAGDSFPDFAETLRGIGANVNVEELADTDLGSSVKIVGVIGYPIEHSLSPVMHNAAFQVLGMTEWRYDKMAIPPDILAYSLRELRDHGVIGVNVTVPHKEAVMPNVLADQLAQRVGAVNTIDLRTRRATNTDVSGFMDDLAAHGIDVHGQKVIVLGAGGAARAVIYGLSNAGAQISVVNRTKDRAVQLLNSLGVSGDVLTLDEAADSGASLIVNCTPVGMYPKAAASPWDNTVPFPRGVTLYDTIYRPARTRLMEQAEAFGGQAINGMGMLVRQGAATFKIFTGVEPPIDVMFEALKAALQEKTI